MEFRLLGPLEVLDAGQQVAVGGHKRRALLALLLLHRNEVGPAERLIDELWDGRPPTTAAKGLQVQVSQLRKELARVSDPNGAATGAADARRAERGRRGPERPRTAIDRRARRGRRRPGPVVARCGRRRATGR